MKYRRPSRIRRMGKWAGLGACLLLVGAAVWSLLFPTHSVWLEGTETWVWGTGRCAVECGHGMNLVTGGSSMLWLIGCAAETQWMPTVRRATAGGRTATYLCLPLWIPFVVVGMPTGILWLRDRRPPKGHCRICGYDLTNNVSGTCSECGTPTEQDDEDPSQSASPSDAAEAERRA